MFEMLHYACEANPAQPRRQVKCGAPKGPCLMLSEALNSQRVELNTSGKSKAHGFQYKGESV
jgi:hypothetical protein